MAFNRFEQEAIILNAAWEMIDDMVNFAIFMPLGERKHETNLMPQTHNTLRLFNLLLGDFLSPLQKKGTAKLPFGLSAPPNNARLSNFTFLYYIRQVCDDPKLCSNVELIRHQLEAFSDWLEEESVVEKVWLPSVNVEVDLKIRRITWLKICGDIGKHSFARLEGNVKKIVRILGEHGHPVDEGMAYTVLPEFWEWFHTHLFAYHASTIAEFLNNIRWAFFECLRPEFERAYNSLSTDPMYPNYEFIVPDQISEPIARTMYWDLMNRVRSEPWFPRFTVTPHLKSQF